MNIGTRGPKSMGPHFHMTPVPDVKMICSCVISVTEMGMHLLASYVCTSNDSVYPSTCSSYDVPRCTYLGTLF